MPNVKEKEVQYNSAKPWQLVAFAFNNSVSNVQYFMFLMFFIYYATDSLGLSAVIVGAIMTFSRIFDAITDPIIGLLVDKMNSRFGKFRPFIFVGTLIMDICIIALFWGVDFQSTTSEYLWIGGWYALWVLGYTCVTITTKGAQTILTNNPKQRPLVGGIDQVIMTGIDILIFSFGMIVLEYFGGVGSIDSFRKFAFLVAGLSTLFAAISIAGIWEKDNANYYGLNAVKDKKEEKVSFKDYWSIIKSNKALQMLILAASTNKIALVMQSSATAYFFIIVMGDPALQAVINAPATLISIFGSFAAIAMAVRWGLKKSFVIGTVLSALSIVILLIFRPFGGATLPLTIVLISFMRFSERITDTNIIPMVADITDYEVWKNNRYAPGIISTIFSSIDKLVSSFAGLLLGGILTGAGYAAGMEVTPKLYWSILFLYLGMPLIGHLCSLIGMKFYPINKEFYAKMISDINKKNEIAAEPVSEVVLEG